MEGFPVAETATNVTLLSLVPMCALIQPCTCVTQSMHHAGPNPAQQNYPWCPTWSAGCWFDVLELPGWQGLVVF